VKRVQKLFTEEEFKADIEAISFDNLCKIQSDLVHFSVPNFVSKEIISRIDK